jgi:methylated-DNA-[protein]-cysteine S-methyltransferase
MYYQMTSVRVNTGTGAMTAFQARVYEAVSMIPKGKVSTYKLIAEYIGTRAYRAVGNALRRNPFAPGVPCHRVIATDLTIGGFGGKRTGEEIEKKIELLTREGVTFKNNRLKDTERLFTFGGI